MLEFSDQNPVELSLQTLIDRLKWDWLLKKTEYRGSKHCHKRLLHFLAILVRKTQNGIDRITGGKTKCKFCFKKMQKKIDAAEQNKTVGKPPVSQTNRKPDLHEDIIPVKKKLL